MAELLPFLDGTRFSSACSWGSTNSGSKPNSSATRPAVLGSILPYVLKIACNEGNNIQTPSLQTTYSQTASLLSYQPCAEAIRARGGDDLGMLPLALQGWPSERCWRPPNLPARCELARAVLPTGRPIAAAGRLPPDIAAHAAVSQRNPAHDQEHMHCHSIPSNTNNKPACSVELWLS